MSEVTHNQKRKNSGRTDLWVILGIAIVLIVAVVAVLLRLLDQSEKHVETVKDMKVGYSDSTWNPETHDCEVSIERDVDANPNRREGVFEQLNLSDKGMKQISRLKHLTNLNLTGSTLKDDWLKHVEKLPLVMLNLTATDITNKGLESVARIATLQQLTLNELAGIDDQSFVILAPLKNLTKIHFKGANVTANGIKGLTAFPLLIDLHSGESNATEGFLRELSELKGLKELKLEQSKISSEGISHLAKLKDLKKLYLDGCNISDKHAAALAELQNVFVISLVNNPLGDTGLAELEKNKGVAHLNLNECKNITSKGIEHFARARPGCQVSHSFGQEELNKSLMSDEP